MIANISDPEVDTAEAVYCNIKISEFVQKFERGKVVLDHADQRCMQIGMSHPQQLCFSILYHTWIHWFEGLIAFCDKEGKWTVTAGGQRLRCVVGLALGLFPGLYRTKNGQDDFVTMEGFVNHYRMNVSDFPTEFVEDWGGMPGYDYLLRGSSVLKKGASPFPHVLQT